MYHNNVKNVTVTPKGNKVIQHTGNGQNKTHKVSSQQKVANMGQFLLLKLTM